MRLVEIRLLDGPNVYRLEPAVKIEVTVGRRRTWYGERSPGRYAVVRLGRPVRRGEAPGVVNELARWVDVLHRRSLKRHVPVTIHRTSEPGHWIVVFPWTREEQAETLARAAFRLADEPSASLAARAERRIAQSGGREPAWITDAERRVRVISVSGTNGKSTTARMITHICRVAGMHVGTTTTDGVLVDEEMAEPGDFTGPAGARQILARDDLDMAVLETARGGILLRGLGYESNDASVLTNISADHLDLQGVHTLPELAEVKSVINRVTKPTGAVVLNADDPLVAGVARWVKAPVFYFTLGAGTRRRVREHLAKGRTAFVIDDGAIVERTGVESSRIVALADVPTTLLGLARHNVANALAAAGGARALGIDRKTVAAGLRDFPSTADLMPGRLNLYGRGNTLVVVDYAHNEAGLEAVLDTVDALVGKRGKRQSHVTVVIGTAGDRPEDSLRSIGRIAAERGDRVTIKESLTFLRGRTRAAVIGELLAGAKTAGASASDVAVHVDELTALTAELEHAVDGDATPERRVIVLMCHEQRPEVRAFLLGSGFSEVVEPADVRSFRG